MVRAVTAFLLSVLLTAATSISPTAEERVIEVVADKDSRFKLEGQTKPVMRLKAAEKVTLRIIAHRAKTWNRDASVHGFTMLRKDGSEVPGWNFLLKDGVNEFQATVPNETGDYMVICTVVCSPAHEGMNMKVVVTP